MKCEECNTIENLEKVMDEVGIIKTVIVQDRIFYLCEDCKNEYYTVINCIKGIDVVQLNRM